MCMFLFVGVFKALGSCGYWVDYPPDNGGLLFFPTILGSQSMMERWSGSTLSFFFRVPGFSECVCVCVCVCVSARLSVCSP